MPHSPSDARDVIDRKCTFPAEHDEVVEALDGEHIRSPHGEPVPMATVIAVGEDDRYESADDLHSVVLANLGEEHVGRKEYDDRAPNHGRDDHLSF